jgi:iron complex outermembrane receptor protein
LINGVEVTNNLYDNQFYYYNFPADLIKRIEFKKTPDSVTYGKNAFLGVINVITLDASNKNQFYTYASDKNSYSAVLFQKFDKNRLLLDLYYEYSFPALYSQPVDYINLQDYSVNLLRGPTLANSKEKNLGLGVSYKKGHSKISYRLQYYKKGNFFGFLDVTPIEKDKFIYMTHQYLNYEFSKYLSVNLKETLNMGIRHYEWNGAYRLFPYDFNTTDPDKNDPSHDIITHVKIYELDYYLNNVLKYESIKHTLRFFLNAEYSKPYGYEYKSYIPALNETLPYAPLKSDIKTFDLGMGFSDIWSFTDDFALNYGYRLDYYKKFGYKGSYKLGLVYNRNNYTTLKFLYNTAYRTPSWVELYSNVSQFKGNDHLSPENIQMFEFIWLQRIFGNDEFKLAAYYGVNKDAIMRYMNEEGLKEYINVGDVYIKGYELSYRKNFKKMNFFVSYSYNDNKTTYQEIIGKVNRLDWLGVRKHWFKSFVLYNYNKKLSCFAGILYGSKIPTPIYVSDISPYFSADLTFTYKKKNDTFQFGIKNLTDHKNYYFAEPSDIVDGHYFFRFQNPEIPAVGREIFISYKRSW